MQSTRLRSSLTGLFRSTRSEHVEGGVPPRHRACLPPRRTGIETLEARIAPATFTVTTAADSGAGSLRAAIGSANADAVADTILFNIPGSGVHTIQLSSNLPTITQPVTINGASETGYVDQPLVELNGANFVSRGFYIEADHVTVKGLAINRFLDQGIFVESTANHAVIQGCFIGVDATGTVARPINNGIVLKAPDCTIGGTAATEHNVISGNKADGIWLFGSGVINTVIKGNFIGTNLLGSLQIPNGGSGVFIQGGSGNLVGGSLPGEGNVISGNGSHDVSLSNANGNTIAGNVIGLDLPMKVELQSMGDGIRIAGTSANNLIGGTAAGARNVIAAHDEAGRIGINLNGTGTGNTILNNLIGTNPEGDDELQNVTGIYVTAPGTIIGDLAGHGNFIAGNQAQGVNANFANNLQLLGNRIGIYSAAGDSKLANGGDGVSILGGSGAIIRGNTIGGNAGDGLYIGLAAGATIQGNFIGTDSLGVAARPNGVSGINVFNCTGLLVGGSGIGQANVLSGNGKYGIDVASTSPVTIYGNLIGTDATGKIAIPDGDSGIRIYGGSGHVIGGAGVGQGNVVSGSFRGVQLASDGNFVRGNIIGLDKDALAKTKFPSTDPFGAGVYIFSGANNTIGGTGAGEGNIIAGNNGDGIVVGGGAGTGNQIVGNLIGTNSAGAAGLGNGGTNVGTHGISVFAAGTIIGGPGAARNIIASSAGRGIHISNAADVRVENNWIGLAPDGVTKLGNLAGIALSSAGTTGAMILDNVISGSTTWGIAGTDNGGHTIQGNRIGTNAAGTAIIANGQQGMIFNRESNMTIGGAGAGQGNLIAGSGIDAILLNGGTNITVVGNRIGTNAAGTAALPNQEGISINSAAGSLASGVLVSGNLIAGTNGSGINLSGAQTDTRVQGNSIGFAANGTDPLPNGQGISIGNGSGILIGGTVAQGNAIGFNTGAGIGIYFANSGGITISGNTLRQNVESGITADGTTGAITIGGTGNNGNTISGNTGPGVILDAAQHVTVLGNAITGNGGVGVLVKNAAGFNTVGGTTAGAGNSITNNGGAGVAVTGGSGTTVAQNVITGNAGLAIDLGAAGATPNDAADADTGANALQNAPVLGGVALLPNGHTILLGSLGSTANGAFRIELFSGANGAAQQFLSSTGVSTDASGNTAFQLDLGVLPAGQQVIATATNLATGNTSELGALTAAPTVPTLTISDASVMEGNAGSASAVFTVTLSGVPTLPVSFAFNTAADTATTGQDFTATSGTFTFPAGTTSLTTTISVPVVGDLIAEAAEQFTLKLSNAQSVYLLGDTGTGTILNDDTTLVIDATHRIAHWRDLDGDLVTLKTSKPILSADDFIFLADGQGGEQLAALLLGDDGVSAAKTNIQLAAKRDPLHPLGNGRANLGFLDAAGIDLGAVLISGDLGRIAAGDTVLKTPGAKNLSIGSLGFFGTSTQTAGGGLQSEIAGPLGSLTVRGDVAQASLHDAGAIGKVSIGGDLRGGGIDFSGSIRADGKLASFTLGGSLIAGGGNHSGAVESNAAIGKILIKGSVVNGGHIVSGGTLGSVTIGGSLAGLDATQTAVISAAGNIANVKIGGSVSDASILAGFSPSGVAVNPDATTGAVRVTDNWIASNLIAGISAGADGTYGTGNDDEPATPVAPLTDKPQVFSKIASIQVGGYVAGTAGNSSDHFAFTAQQIGKLSIGNLAYVLNGKASDSFALGLTGDATLKEVV